MDIQSDTMTHTWHFCGDEIIDFHHPGNNKYPWLFWNARPERKSFYLTAIFAQCNYTLLICNRTLYPKWKSQYNQFVIFYACKSIALK